MARLLSAAALIFLAAGCAGGRPSRPASGGQYLILSQELEASRQTNLYDAVRHLRPQWLTRRVGNRTGESAIAVYLDGQLIGGFGQLARIPTYSTARVRYLSPNEAQVRYGHINGMRAAVEVETARP